MSTTELDDVQALLERVLPDPSGFAQRLLLQVVTQWGPLAQPDASNSNSTTNTFYTVTPAEDVKASETVIPPDSPTTDDMPIDTNMLLAAALGACECWGSLPTCHLCRGRGSAGWTQPDLQLFEEFVGPAIAKLSGTRAGGHDQHGCADSDEVTGNHQTRQGENA
jgi:hypothetical protein